jgi:uncharacterized protein
MSFRRAQLSVAPIAVIASLVGCSGSPARPDAPDVNFDRNALLAHLATEVMLPMQADVDTKAALVPAAIEGYCSALDVGATGGTLDAARVAATTAWADAVDAWQRADALLVGPAAMDDKALRDRIYAWPSLAPCDLDRDTVSRWNNPGGYDITTKLARQRSLASIEFLLFPPSDQHNCISEPAGWGALAADLPRARCRLAHTLAVDVAAAAAQLHLAWRADGGDYVGQLARAGTSGSSLPGAHEALNLVSDSFFYIDRMVKDMKLGEAAGIVMGNACGVIGQPCLREVELRYADRGAFAIRANLAALREAVTGTTATSDGPGFDDFLIAVGHPDLAAQMIGDLDDAIAKAAALPDSYLDALANSYAAVVATHTATREFTNHLKSQFLTVLALDIPDDVASDND